MKLIKKIKYLTCDDCLVILAVAMAITIYIWTISIWIG